MTAICKEKAQYLEIGAERLYVITFGCEAPKAKVLLCGPSPSNRLFSLAAWVRWARFLAQHNFAAVRFDYRGTGESTGEFLEMTFRDWLDDIQQVSAWADSQLGKSPLVLHGMGMGGLLAQRVFNSGRGDALLLWSPLPRAADVFDQALRMRLSLDMVQVRGENRKSAQHYMSEMASGKPFEAEGYYWSFGLWQSASEINLDTTHSQPGEGVAGRRPWRHARLGVELVPLTPSVRQQSVFRSRATLGADPPLNPDFNPFFESNVEWLRRVVEAGQG